MNLMQCRRVLNIQKGKFLQNSYEIRELIEKTTDN